MITKKGADISGVHAEQGFGSFNTSFEEQSNIFERFYRSKDLSHTIVGFGLGL